MKRFAIIVALVLSLPLLAAYTTMRPMPTPDQMSGAVVGISNEHSKLHDGLAFYAHYESEAPLPTNAGEETAIGFVTPATASGRVHMVIDVRADEESVWELREDPAITLDQGLAALPRNRFRDSDNTSGMLPNEAAAVAGAVSTYTVIAAAAGNLAGGTILEHETLAIAGGPPFGGVGNSEARGEREWILMASTEYVIIITSSTIADTVHEIALHWYETVDKNYIR